MYKVVWTALWPVYYHVPIYKEVDKLENIELRVFFYDDIGIRPMIEEDFGSVSRSWADVDLLGGYSHRFLKNWTKHNNDKGIFTLFNPSIFLELIKERPHLVVIQSYATFSDIFAFLGAKLIGAKVIFRGEAVINKNNTAATLKRRIKNWLLPKYLRICDSVLYSCKGNKEYWQQHGVDTSKLFPIPCAVDNDYFQSEYRRYLSDVDKIKEELGIDKNDFVVIFVAKFTKNKNAIDLAKSIELINRDDITLLYVGDGSEKIVVEKYCEEKGIKSVFVGYKAQTEVSRYYSISDLFVLISDYDYSPKAMNEAMNFKLPIICTNAAGTAYDLIGDNGFLIDTGDIQSMSEHIKFLVGNRDVAKMMGKKSLETVNE